MIDERLLTKLKDAGFKLNLLDVESSKEGKFGLYAVPTLSDYFSELIYHNFNLVCKQNGLYAVNPRIEKDYNEGVWYASPEEALAYYYLQIRK